ncbi:hypothetical protein [Olleya sp. HaHaR_3_96]|uniref:hypothetical protein n=1 Tax=Olleya sp. HaHaR_3_96 TaxID=2745560 RepID=UPI001C4F002C|nr:hypothetical protein [Olleya sp. HaHaR_3_96]QXP58995.1 hypothetical protein H0I26_13865 [Olleya sp. HaHaR_3_96]
MAFIVDRQTQTDLGIFNKTNNSSFSYYNAAKTKGGKNDRHTLMAYPLCDILAIATELFQSNTF